MASIFFGARSTKWHPTPRLLTLTIFAFNRTALSSVGNLIARLTTPRIEAGFISHLYKQAAQAQVGHIENAFHVAEKRRAPKFQSRMLSPFIADFNVLASKVDHFLFNSFIDPNPNGAKNNTFTLDFNGTLLSRNVYWRSIIDLDFPDDFPRIRNRAFC
jgi:hypothetical protein